MWSSLKIIVLSEYLYYVIMCYLYVYIYMLEVVNVLDYATL